MPGNSRFDIFFTILLTWSSEISKTSAKGHGSLPSFGDWVHYRAILSPRAMKVSPVGVITAPQWGRGRPHPGHMTWGSLQGKSRIVVEFESLLVSRPRSVVKHPLEMSLGPGRRSAFH